jgi:hypothetical protein
MTVNEPVEFYVVIVLTERVDKNFGNFQPPDVEAELKRNNETQMT